MRDLDSTLAEDFDWALFPQEEARLSPVKRWAYWLAVGCLVEICWFVCEPVAVGLACVAVFYNEFRITRLAARFIPDQSAALICWFFGLAWGAWKVGATAFVMMFMAIFLAGPHKQRHGIPLSLVIAMITWLAAFCSSAAFTASGLIMAYRSEMRVWIGEGVNQARTLLMGMLITGSMLLVILPAFFVLPWLLPRHPGQRWARLLIAALGLCGMFGVPLAILLSLDRLSRRIVASHPGKFGPKVPSVKKGSG